MVLFLINLQMIFHFDQVTPQKWLNGRKLRNILQETRTEGTEENNIRLAFEGKIE